mmetsp:Transcript_14546/g.36355  ORF Transcript_14546/g.36355 Transcript_14546/m.36355 type:complete len:361 (-) Transcript_14546:1822-2904(-)
MRGRDARFLRCRRHCFSELFRPHPSFRGLEQILRLLHVREHEQGEEVVQVPPQVAAGASAHVAKQGPVREVRRFGTVGRIWDAAGEKPGDRSAPLVDGPGQTRRHPHFGENPRQTGFGDCVVGGRNLRDGEGLRDIHIGGGGHVQKLAQVLAQLTHHLFLIRLGYCPLRVDVLAVSPEVFVRDPSCVFRAAVLVRDIDYFYRAHRLRLAHNAPPNHLVHKRQKDLPRHPPRNCSSAGGLARFRFQAIKKRPALFQQGEGEVAGQVEAVVVRPEKHLAPRGLPRAAQVDEWRLILLTIGSFLQARRRCSAPNARKMVHPFLHEPEPPAAEPVEGLHELLQREVLLPAAVPLVALLVRLGEW